jgi:tRNA threonylcarbamoyladenosine biosynthesis protein TsaB
VNILALDTACPVFSAALKTGTGFWYLEADAGMRHSELLMDITDNLFKYAGQDASSLSLVVCMKGPGSFTGLRIGFAVAKGMALALSIDFKAVPTLDCMAFPHSAWPGIVVPVIDAKKKRFFTALYHRGESIGPCIDAGISDLANAIEKAAQKVCRKDMIPLDKEKPAAQLPEILLAGPDAEEALFLLKKTMPGYTFFLDPQRKRGRAFELLEIVKSRGRENEGSDIFCGPEYIRKSDAEMKADSKISNLELFLKESDNLKRTLKDSNSI